MSEHDRIIVQWKELLEEKKHQIAHLQDVIQQLDNHQSLSRSTIQNLYAAFNALRRQINIMDTVIQKSDCEMEVIVEMEEVKQRFNELEKCLP